MLIISTGQVTVLVSLIWEPQSALKYYLDDHARISKKQDLEKVMKQNYKDVAEDLQKSVGQLAKQLPDTMKAFSSLGAAAKKNGALDPKTKELIATAIAVAVRCDGCIASHVKALEQHGAKREEVLEMLSMSIYMGGGPSVVYAAEALTAYDQFSE